MFFIFIFLGNKRYSWIQGAMQGNDILTDHLVLVWGFLRGAFGISTSLVSGNKSKACESVNVYVCMIVISP